MHGVVETGGDPVGIIPKGSQYCTCRAHWFPLSIHPAMDSLLVPLANASGASLDQIKLIACLLVSYPLGSLFIRIPSSQPALKHAFNLAIAFFYFIPVLNLRGAFLQLLGDVLATYFIAANVRGPNMPWIVFGVLMGHLTINHIIRALFAMGYETFDITGPQMVLVMKLTTFAWNVWDGRRPQEDLDKWQIRMRVVKYPSILEFLGYAFYFPGVLVGPYLEYAAYMSLIDETLFQISEPPSGVERRRAIPDGRKRVAYRKLAFGLFYLGLFAGLGPSFNYGVTLSDWFQAKSLTYRILYLQICGPLERAKYYALWTLTEGSSILTGLGFTGYSPSGQSLWEGAANVNVSLIENAPNFKVLLDSWNMKTNIWLRECVYKRVTPKGKKPGFKSSMITFATSAFWHGIALGYYLTFLFGGFMQTAGRLCRSSLRPLLLPVSPTPSMQQSSTAANGVPEKKMRPTEPPRTTLKQAYDIAGTVVTVSLTNYATLPFMLSTWSSSIASWTSLGWYGHWMLAVCFLFFYGGGRAWLKGVQARRVQRATGVAVPLTRSNSSADVQSAHVVPPFDSAISEVQKSLK
ncbi:MBOAT-domain-containing protein [Auriscalpium vulgare]|uniref:MBOAT-domain-containing protein n=1 Tax=Auriscalpium vulgare TaxID=40419 RepID=A0ACB8RUJ6_9AGAM|nr:MBOAT-domain-containing protein [Auriscalpium vulgare]